MARRCLGRPIFKENQAQLLLLSLTKGAPSATYVVLCCIQVVLAALGMPVVEPLPQNDSPTLKFVVVVIGNPHAVC